MGEMALPNKETNFARQRYACGDIARHQFVDSNPDLRREALLALAKTAENKADKATDPDVKVSWHKIAEGYRALTLRPGATSLPRGS